MSMNIFLFQSQIKEKKVVKQFTLVAVMISKAKVANRFAKNAELHGEREPMNVIRPQSNLTISRKLNKLSRVSDW